MQQARVGIALAFDSGMVAQARACIRSIRAHCRYAHDVHVLAIDLAPADVAALRADGVHVREDHAVVPTFAGAPAYARAMTCRPHLRELFPGHDVYLWVDSDVRFLAPDAFDFYVQHALARPDAVVAAQEVDTTYAFVRDPQIARNYHAMKLERIAGTFGPEAAAHLQYFTCYNAGLFALHRTSPVWEAYRRNVERAIATGFGHMKEQDALNVAIAECGGAAVAAPVTMNWLCSVSFPRWDHAVGRWVRPSVPAAPISVVHLTNSGDRVTVNGEDMTYYELYQRLQLTA